MTLQVEMKSVPAKLPDMLAAVKNGDEVLIVDNNHPVAQLIAVKQTAGAKATKKPKRKLGSCAGKIWIADDFDAPLDDFKDYM